MSLQLREGGIHNTLIASGYLLGLGAWRTAGGPSHEGWTERITREALFQALANRPSMRLLVDGRGIPVARTSDGTMRLFVDDIGLHMQADLLATNPDVSRLDGGERLEVNYTVTRDEWNLARTERTITAISLDGYDAIIAT